MDILITANKGAMLIRRESARHGFVAYIVVDTVTGYTATFATLAGARTLFEIL